MEYGVERSAERRRSWLLAVVLVACASVTLAAGVGGGSARPASRTRAAADVAPSESTPTTLGLAQPVRSSIEGSVLAVDPAWVRVRTRDGTTAAIPIDGATPICRIACSAVWTEIEPGDDVYAGIEQIGTTTLTRFVNVNSVGGWVAVDAVDDDGLIVHWSRDGARREPFRLHLGWETRWDCPLGDTRVCPGDTLHIVASADVPITADAPPPEMWAITVGADPKDGCTTTAPGVRTP